MDIREEMLYDFGITLPRILIGGKSAVIDNIKKIVLLEPEQIVVQCGKKYTAITGREMSIKQLEDERMLIIGEIQRVEFY